MRPTREPPDFPTAAELIGGHGHGVPAAAIALAHAPAKFSTASPPVLANAIAQEGLS